MTTLGDALQAVSDAVAPGPNAATSTRQGLNTLTKQAATSSRWSCRPYPPDGAAAFNAWIAVRSVDYPTFQRSFMMVRAALILQFERRNPGTTWGLMAEIMDSDGLRKLLEGVEITTDDGSIIDVTVEGAQLGTPDQTSAGNYATLRFPLTIRFT